MDIEFFLSKVEGRSKLYLYLRIYNKQEEDEDSNNQ